MVMGMSFRQARYRAAAVTWQRVLCLATPQREAATEDLDGRHRGAGRCQRAVLGGRMGGLVGSLLCAASLSDGQVPSAVVLVSCRPIQQCVCTADDCGVFCDQGGDTACCSWRRWERRPRGGVLFGG